MRPLHTLLLVLAFVFAAGQSAAAAPPPGLTEREALAAYDAGVAAYGQGHYRDAAERFAVAFSFFSDPNILWNLSLALERAGDLAEAQGRMRELLARSDLEPSLRDKAKVASERVGKKLDARAAAETTAARIAVVEAERAEAEEAGNTELVRCLDAELGELRAAARREGPPVREPPVAAAGGRSHVLDWTLVGTGGAALAAGVITWLMGDGKHGDLEAAQRNSDDGVVGDLTRMEALKLREDGDTLKTVGVIVGAVGLAAVSAGLTLLLVDDGPSGEGRVEVGSVPLPGGAALVLDGRW